MLQSVKILCERKGDNPHSKWLKKHGIKTEGMGLGYSEKENKWYGWSHRAQYGFKVGDKVKKGDVTAGYLPIGFTAKTEKDAKKMAEAFRDSVS